MTTINRKNSDIKGLLETLSAKQEELPKTPVQTVQPVVESEEEKKRESSKAVKTLKSKNSKTGKPMPTAPENYRGMGGRPSLKKASIEYVKISPRIPKLLKKQVDMALVQERFQDEEGNHIRTLDEVVALALALLLRQSIPN